MARPHQNQVKLLDWIGSSAGLGDTISTSWVPVGHVSLPLAGSTFATTGCMNNMPNQTDLITALGPASAYTRYGRKITMRSIHFKAYFMMLGALATPFIDAGAVRIIVVYDKQPNGVLATEGDIFYLNGQGQAVTYTYNVENLDRFLPIIDKTMYLSSTGPSAVGFEQQVDLNLETDYGSIAYQPSNDVTCGMIDNITTGSLLCLMVGDQVVNSGTYTVQVEASARICFTNN